MLRRRVMMPKDKGFNGSLFHFDKSFSGVYKDEYGNVWTGNGTEPNISTTQKKFGSASWRQDNNANIRIDTKLDYQDFTIEAWIYPTATGYDYLWRRFFSVEGGGLYLSNAEVGYNYPYNYWYWKPAGTNVYISATIATILTWHHVAIVYNNSTVMATLYIDGQQIGNKQNVVWDSNRPEHIAINIGSVSLAYIDEFRFSKGQVYTNDFTPPTRPFDK